MHPLTVRNDASPTRVRYSILAAIFINVVINYMDRSNISVAAPFIIKSFSLDAVQMGYIFSAFGWTYAFLQIPGGVMTDRFGSRILYSISLILWSLATLLQGFVKGFASLLGLRIAIGAFEAPAYPMNNRIVTSWFPDGERASAIAVYTSGQFIGLAFLTPVLTALENWVGWRGLFYCTGIAGLVWGIIWWLIYRDPLQARRVNQAELDHIEKGGGLIQQDKKTRTKFEWKNLHAVLSKRKLWGIYIGQFGVNSTLWFFLTWFPTYLVKYRGLNFLQSGMLSSIPFLAAFAGILFSGFLSDYLIKKGVSAGLARKTPVITGLLLSVSIVGANFVNSPFLITLFMTIAFFGNGLASITWIFVSALAPKHLLGLTGGVFNFAGGMAAIIVPVAIGYLVQGGNFSPALIFIGCMALMGALSYLLLVGKVERIKTENDPRSFLQNK